MIHSFFFFFPYGKIKMWDAVERKGENKPYMWTTGERKNSGERGRSLTGEHVWHVQGTGRRPM